MRIEKKRKTLLSWAYKKTIHANNQLDLDRAALKYISNVPKAYLQQIESSYAPQSENDFCFVPKFIANDWRRTDIVRMPANAP